MALYSKVLKHTLRLIVAGSRMPSSAPRREAPAEPAAGRSTPEAPPSPTAIKKPGCTAADSALLVHGHLRGLAKGWGGFGVLQQTKGHLELGARAAMQSGDRQLSLLMSQLAESLHSIQTPEQAAHAAKRLEPGLEVAWGLAKRCGMSQHVLYQQAEEMANLVKEGKISRQDAIDRLREAALGDQVP